MNICSSWRKSSCLVLGGWILMLLFTALCTSTVIAEGGASVFTGTVTDVDGRPVEGARIFVYDSAEVRRSADYISPPTDQEGRFRMVLPSGTFWSIARLKKGDAYGPLMPGDKHSGDPMTIDLSPDAKTTQDFVVVDLRDAQKKRKREREGPVTLRGRLIDDRGAPVAGAYVFASKRESVIGVPDFVSPWVEADGSYTLCLPKGTYYLGSATEFPPGKDYSISEKVTVNADQTGLDVVKRPLKTNN